MALVLIVTALWSGCSTSRKAPELDVLGQAPAFTLTDQDGRETSLADYKGKLLLVDFIYTSCPDVCPILTSQLAKLQGEIARDEKLHGKVELLSISVDPERDTPAALKDFAARHGADLSNWRFLTGPLEKVRQVVIDGFHFPMNADGGHSQGGMILHTSRIVVVDGEGRIRAYYASEDWQPAQVLKDLRTLAE